MNKFVFVLNKDYDTGEKLKDFPDNNVCIFSPEDIVNHGKNEDINKLRNLIDTNYSNRSEEILNMKNDELRACSVLVTMHGMYDNDRKTFVNIVFIISKAFPDLFKHAAVEYWFHSADRDFKRKHGFIDRQLQAIGDESDLSLEFTPIIQYIEGNFLENIIKVWLFDETREKEEYSSEESRHNEIVKSWLTNRITNRITNHNTDRLTKEIPLKARLDVLLKGVMDNCKKENIPYIFLLDDTTHNTFGNNPPIARKCILHTLFNNIMPLNKEKNEDIDTTYEQKWNFPIIDITKKKIEEYDLQWNSKGILDYIKYKSINELKGRTKGLDDLDLLILVADFLLDNDLPLTTIDLLEHAGARNLLGPYQDIIWVYISSISWETLQVGSTAGVIRGLHENIRYQVGPNLFPIKESFKNGILHHARNAIDWKQLKNYCESFNNENKLMGSSDSIPTYLSIIEFIVRRLEHTPSLMFNCASQTMAYTFYSKNSSEEFNPYDYSICKLPNRMNSMADGKVSSKDIIENKYCKHCLTALVGKASEFSFHYERIKSRPFWIHVADNYWKEHLSRDSSMKLLDNKRLKLKDVDYIMDLLSSVIIDFLDTNRLSAKSKGYMQIIIETLEKYNHGKRVYPCPMIMEAMIKW